jgi:hypothetical protein
MLGLGCKGIEDPTAKSLKSPTLRVAKKTLVGLRPSYSAHVR